MAMNDSLKQQRTSFYKEDMDRFVQIAKQFLELSGSTCAMLVDKEGHLIVKQGDTESFDIDTISALVAGSFAATREIAKMLGEEEFSVMFQQGRRDSIQLSLVGQRALFVVVFNEQTTVGMVRLYADQAVKKLAQLVDSIEARNQTAGREEETLGEDFDDSAKNKLDSFFKE